MRAKLGSLLLIIGRGTASIAVGLNVLVGLGCVYLAIRFMTEGQAGAGVGLFFIGIPLFSGLLYLIAALLAVPLMWLGSWLNPSSRFGPDLEEYW